ncbi:MAG: ABC transporter substrate-binding protein [Solirubrobacteraceae bacterium]|nr:ABC transporter substrate-binding protein [Solirubrobacteraceae bacterium]
MRLRRPVAGLASLTIALGLAACGSDDSSSDSGSSESTGSTSASTITVPEAIKGKGSLKIAADASYAPNEFIEPGGKDIVGMDVDLGKAIGEKLGLKVEFENATFDAIIPGLAAAKYDLGMSSFTDTKEREQTVDFVTYFSAGTSFFVKSDGGPAVASLEDLCGKKVAVQKGTTQADDVQAQAKKCKLTALVYPDQNAANLALKSDRADVSLADSPVAAYQVKQSAGAFKLSGEAYGTAPYGIAIPKDSGLADPVLEAVKALIADGSYTKILEQWGVEAGAITDPVINGAES